MNPNDMPPPFLSDAEFADLCKNSAEALSNAAEETLGKIAAVLEHTGAPAMGERESQLMLAMMMTLEARWLHTAAAIMNTYLETDKGKREQWARIMESAKRS